MRPRTVTGPTLLLAILLLVAGPPTAGAGPVAGSGPLTQVSGTSPWAADPCGLEQGQTGTNYLNSEVEPWVDVNPSDGDGDGVIGDNIVGTYQQDRWSNAGARGLLAGVSMDGGATWESVIIPNVSQCSGNPAYLRASDPWLSFAPNGDLYHASLSFNQISGPQNAVIVSESGDGGLTWPSTVVVATDAQTGGFNDKQSVTADPHDASSVYATWNNDGDAWFSRSTNGAAPGPAMWEPPREIYDAPGVGSIAHQIVVLPPGSDHGGDLINAFKTFGKGNKTSAHFMRSTDNGATWSGPFTIGTIQEIGIRDPETGQSVRAGNFPDVAVDPTSGDLYAVWQDTRFERRLRGKNSARTTGIVFTSSTDGGVTWSAPVKVSQTPTTEPSGDQQAFTPSVDVAQDGSIGVTYYDFRNNTSDPATLLTDHWMVHCHPSSSPCATDPASWSETPVTDAPFDLSEAPVAGGLFVGDYHGLASEGGSFLPFFSQTHTGDPASIFFRRVGP